MTCRSDYQETLDAKEKEEVMKLARIYAGAKKSNVFAAHNDAILLAKALLKALPVQREPALNPKAAWPFPPTRDEKDAARYRYLRAGAWVDQEHDSLYLNFGEIKTGPTPPSTEAEVDRLVDAAMNDESPEVSREETK